MIILTRALARKFMLPRGDQAWCESDNTSRRSRRLFHGDVLRARVGMATIESIGPLVGWRAAKK